MKVSILYIEGRFPIVNCCTGLFVRFQESCLLLKKAYLGLLCSHNEAVL